MRRMRRFATEPKKPSPPKTREAPSGKEYTDEETGLRYRSGVGIDVMLKPAVGKKTSDYGNTVESIITHAHYQWTKGWDNPDVPGPSELSSKTYSMGVHAGFKGSMTDWHTSILAGRVVRGKVDMTPRRVEKKTEPEPPEEEEEDRVPNRIRLR